MIFNIRTARIPKNNGTFSAAWIKLLTFFESRSGKRNSGKKEIKTVLGCFKMEFSVEEKKLKHFSMILLEWEIMAMSKLSSSSIEKEQIKR